MTADTAVLRLGFRSFWLHARGEGGGADYDLVMERDPSGLPILRGRHLAGLLRVAFARADRWGWFDNPPATGVEALLMGGFGNGMPGCLDIRSARVPDPLRSTLVSVPGLIEACFQRLPTTAIDPVRGVAKTGHLRTIEAAMPMQLEARIRFDASDRLAWSGGTSADVDNGRRTWIDWLRCALPALDEAGAKRTRGFGRLGRCDVITGGVPAR